MQPEHPDSHTRKAALRRAALQQRRDRAGDREEDRDRLAAALADLLAGAVAVASYVPVGTEPGLPPRPGWLLPVLLPDDDLDWGRYDGTLVPGRRGLLEPAGPRLGRAAVAGCDVVLVPALRVDRAGRRLGKGGGSYDRALARATGLTVALLHDGELVDALPDEPHDVPVAAIATPSSGLVRLRGR